eukprot:2469809-Rhodomonas_salina.1
MFRNKPPPPFGSVLYHTGGGLIWEHHGTEVEPGSHTDLSRTPGYSGCDRARQYRRRHSTARSQYTCVRPSA